MRFKLVFLTLALALAGFAAKSSGLIDVNHASLAELRALPGIQDAYAQAIVKNRPYKNKTQLLRKQVIPEAAYQKIRTRIIAKQ